MFIVHTTLRPLLLTCVLMTLANTGCPTSENACRTQTDCPAFSICVVGQCVLTCNSDAECGDGASCELGLCVAGAVANDAGDLSINFPIPDDPANPDDDAGEEPDEDAGEEPLEDAGIDAGVDAGEEPLQDAGDIDAGIPDAGENDAGIPDAGDPDAGVDAGVDAGIPDAGDPDAGADAGEPDAGPLDPCLALDPFGRDVTGDCLPDVVLAAPSHVVSQGANAIEGNIFIIPGDANGNLILNDVTTFTDNIVGGLLGESLALSPAYLPSPSQHRLIVAGRPNPNGNCGFSMIHIAEDRGTNFNINTPNLRCGDGVAVAGGAASGIPRVAVGLPNANRNGNNVLGRIDVATEQQFLDGNALSVFLNTLVSGVTSRNFGQFVTRIDDRDNDGETDFIASTLDSDVGGISLGAVMFSSNSLQRIGEPIFTPVLFGSIVGFGTEIVVVPDMDRDGEVELVFTAPNDGVGRVFIAPSSLNEPNSISVFIEITPSAGLGALSQFGASVVGIGDADGDDASDLLIGAPLHSTLANNSACDPFAAANYSGSCEGRIDAFTSTTLRNVIALGQFSVAAQACLASGVAAGRFGTSMQAFGIDIQQNLPTVVIGRPGTVESTSGFQVITLGIFGNNQCVALSTDNINTDDLGVLMGQQFAR